jgi:hypothetical protein
VFTADELEAAICGLGHIDVKDWQEHTEYKGFRNNSGTVKRFWKAMQTYN